MLSIDSLVCALLLFAAGADSDTFNSCVSLLPLAGTSTLPYA